MIEDIKKISSTKKDLEQFAVVMAVACAIIAGLLVWREKETWRIFGALAATFLFFRLTWPIVLLPLQKAWMTIAVVIGWFVSRIMLSVLFFVAFTGIGVLGRLFGKMFLELEIEKTRESYWEKKPPQDMEPAGYERQF